MKTIDSSIFRMFIIAAIMLINACTPASPSSSLPEPSKENNPQATSPSPLTNTPASDPEQFQQEPQTIAEVEQQASFDVKEPSYLPKGVSFEFAAYEEAPTPAVVLHFKIVHEQYGDMGSFFQIRQEPVTEAPPDMVSCGEITDGCEVFQIGDQPAVYRLNAGGTEGIDWYADGFSFRLLRTAGEPNKIYKDELIKVVESLQK